MKHPAEPLTWNTCHNEIGKAPNNYRQVSIGMAVWESVYPVCTLYVYWPMKDEEYWVFLGSYTRKAVDCSSDLPAYCTACFTRLFWYSISKSSVCTESPSVELFTSFSTTFRTEYQHRINNPPLRVFSISKSNPSDQKHPSVFCLSIHHFSTILLEITVPNNISLSHYVSPTSFIYTRTYVCKYNS